MEFIFFTLLNGISYGLLLFMLSAGLTLIFSMMGVLNFAHASFYMLGAYFAASISAHLGFWSAFLLAPLLVGMAGALVERYGLRRLHQHGPLSELLFTFGISAIIVELVQLIWGRAAIAYPIPAELTGALFSLYGSTFPIYRAFMMAVALAMLAFLYSIFKWSRIGLVIQAALTHSDMVEALGHDVPQIRMWVFGGGCALAGLAGVIGGNAFVTEPGMAATLGSILFVVVVVGGMGSLVGAFAASLLIGVLQTYAVTLDYSLVHLLAALGAKMSTATPAYPLLRLTIAQVAPILPYLLLVLLLIFKPNGLMGTKDV